QTATSQNTSNNNLSNARDQLQTSYYNLTKERDQLQTSYNNLAEERDQLQTSYYNLTDERDQLQTSYNNLTEERDQLQTSYYNLTNERDRLQERVEVLTKDKNNLQGNSYPYFYYVSSTKKTWQQSRDDCRQKGADLMIINSKEEQDFANRFKKYMWIGLIDSEREGTWKWVDGTLLTKRFSYWASGEPNGRTHENCGDIKNYDAEKSWNDESCSHSLYWVCEKKLLP
uniref:C-type lectin domain-containing protein n=1 Tax=Sparus aurata TaxID=8175 RepID=A0A671TKQ9_SPAAU